MPTKRQMERKAQREAKLARRMVEKPLPPDPEEMNEQRAGWGQNAIKGIMDDTYTELPDALPDLLANLMHWADRQTTDVCVSFEDALQRARDHYEAETAEDS